MSAEYLIMVALSTIGATEIIWLIFKAIKHGDVRGDVELKEGEKECACLVIGIVCLVAMSCLVIPHFEGGIVKKMAKAQHNNCIETLGENEELLTDKQCGYFQNILNGKYSENYDDSFDILKYLGEK